MQMDGQLHDPAALSLQIIVPGTKMIGVCVCVWYGVFEMILKWW